MGKSKSNKSKPTGNAKPKPVTVTDPTKALGNVRAIYPVKVDQTISQITGGR